MAELQGSPPVRQNGRQNSPPDHVAEDGELVIADDLQSQHLVNPAPVVHQQQMVHPSQQQTHPNLLYQQHLHHSQQQHLQMAQQQHQQMMTNHQPLNNYVQLQCRPMSFPNAQHHHQQMHHHQHSVQPSTPNFAHHPQAGHINHPHPMHSQPAVRSQATCELPSTEEFAGDFDFQINVAKAVEETKRAAWEYSDVLKKLFVMEARSVRIQFKVNKPDPIMYVRAVAVFCDPDSSNKPVLRCPIHLQPSAPINQDYKEYDHVIRCNNSTAQYETDAVSQRRSVTVQLGLPQPGSDFVTILYSMMCRSSCPDGINRRSVAIVFTLEIDGRVYGRRVLPIRVCASPNRDRGQEESKVAKTHNGGAGSMAVKEEGQVCSPPSENLPMDPLGAPNRTYYVPVTSCDDLIYLARYAKELVMRDYPEGPLKDEELQRYQTILDTMGDNLG